MWDKLVSFAGEKFLPLLLEAVKVLKGVPKEVAEIKEELERIQDIINGADRMAAAEQQDNTRDGIKTKVKQLREAAFRIEDVTEDYMITEEQQPRDPGCASIPYDTADFIKTTILRLQISYEIQDIKSRVREIIPIQSKPSSQQGSSSSIVSQDDTWDSLRMKAFYIQEADVVGFESPRKELIGWLEEERAERTVISVVGMGGQGKTTLAKTVYDKVIGKFDCHAWITVSQVYTVEGLLRDMLNQFCENKKEAPPNGISEMDRRKLINEVINYLKQKRYVVFFDDVWNKDFWSEIEFAILDNNKRSRILITTRGVEVANFCKASSVVHIQKLEPLTPPQSWELFCKKAFLNEPDGQCPKELKGISSEIVDKCKGLPLAIVAIGSLLATKEKKSSEWESLRETLVSELEKNPNSTGITNTILGLSYDDLPSYLKSCFLYFGIYPEDYTVKSDTLIRQWIAEGFVKKEQKKTLEKVAEQYLKELIYRSLVQVSSLDIDGNPISCRVHDLLHEMILTKIEDLSFCHFIKDDDETVFSGMIRRQKIATNSNNLMVNIEGSHIRSLYIFREEELPEDFVRKIPTNYKLLKVLDFEHCPLSHVPEKLGNLNRLRYLSFRGSNVKSLPNSIGNLQFLETLDLRDTQVGVGRMPREISKLTKLRHLLGNRMEMMDGVGSLVSLQTLSIVDIGYGGEELIKELEKLRQLRLLNLIEVKREYESTLCSSINEMQHLEDLSLSTDDAIDFEGIDLHYISPWPLLQKLSLDGKLKRLPLSLSTDDVTDFEGIDLHDISPLPLLQKLSLDGKLKRLPKCIPELKNLVTLALYNSQLIDDPLESLKDMPNLLCLVLFSAYEGESLHFQDGGFKRLKKLSLQSLNRLNSILIGERALQLLEEFQLVSISELKGVPSGINHLGNLRVLDIFHMPRGFEKSIREDQWINKHVHQVNITN